MTWLLYCSALAPPLKLKYFPNVIVTDSQLDSSCHMKCMESFFGYKRYDSIHRCSFIPERIQYKLAVLAYRVLRGDAPHYLGPLVRVDDLPVRRPLRSTNINRLVVPPVRLSTVDSRAFAVAAPHISNRLPTDVVAANSLSTFRRLLKRFSFRQSYPDIIY